MAFLPVIDRISVNSLLLFKLRVFRKNLSIDIIETALKTPADQSRPRDISAHFSYRLLLDFWLYFPVFSYLRLCSSVFCESIYSLTFSMTVVPVVAMK